MTVEEYLEALRNANAEQRADLIQRATLELDGDGLRRIKDEFPNDTLLLEQVDIALERIGEGPEQTSSEQQVGEFQEDQARQRAESEFLETADRNNDGQVDDDELLAAGQAGVDGAIQGLEDWNQPTWISQEYGRLDDQDRQRIVDEFSIWYGQDFRTWDELVISGALETASPTVQFRVQNAVFDEEPLPAFEVNLGGGRSYSVNAREFDAAQTRWNVDVRNLQRIVRMADELGATNLDGQRVSWQPVLALAQATGVLDRMTGRAPLSTLPAAPPQLGVPLSDGLLGENRPPGAITPDLRPSDTEYTRVSGGVTDQLRSRLPGQDAAFVGPSTVRFSDIVQDWSEGLERFGYDPGLAFIYALDPILATRAAASGGDPRRLSGEDQFRISGLIGSAGLTSRSDWRDMMISAGFAEAELTSSDLMSAYWDRQEAFEGAGDASTRRDDAPTRLPDPEGLNETMRSLYQQMFFEEPDEGTLARFRAQINSAVQGAEGNNLASIDISARAQQFLRGEAKFDELYGNAGGLDPSVYRAQFEAAQGSILGNEITPGQGAVQAGLTSGRYQSTVGAAATQAGAFENSTFMDRLARAANVVGANT